jgi:hypothetical protein
VFGVMSGGAGGHQLLKGAPYQRILSELSFDGGMRSNVGHWIHDFASYRDLPLHSFTQVCALKGIMNVS